MISGSNENSLTKSSPFLTHRPPDSAPARNMANKENFIFPKNWEIALFIVAFAHRGLNFSSSAQFPMQKSFSSNFPHL